MVQECANSGQITGRALDRRFGNRPNSTEVRHDSTFYKGRSLILFNLFGTFWAVQWSFSPGGRWAAAGEVSEWLKEPVSKTGMPFMGIVGSKPTLSAIAQKRHFSF